MDFRINNITPEAESFIAAFTDCRDYVEVHTSGSTGKPKLIRLLKSDMVRSAEASCTFFGITSASRLVCPLSANYIAGKMMIVRAAVSGAELFMETPSNTPVTMDYGTIDLLPVVPSQLVSLLADAEKCKKIRQVIVGGGAVPETMKEQLKNVPFDVFATYGMTETASHVALSNLKTDSGIFYALPGISFAVDAESCLKINAEGFSFSGLQTNDVVKLLDDKSFMWIGRRDNVIITGGVKVHVEEIERKISHLISGDFYVIGVPDDFWGQKVVLYSTVPVDLDSLRPLLTKFEMPKEIRISHHFAYTPTGKIKRIIL